MEQKVIYHCESCGREFVVTQGSRRRFCDACLAERVKAGRRPDADDSEKASSNEKG